MSFGERFGQLFRPKTTEEKEQQLENVQANFEVSLVPSEYAQNSAELMSMSAAELKEKFPERYRMYLELLRAQKRQESQDENKFTQADVGAMKRRLVMMNNLDQYVAGLQEGEDTHLREHQTSVFEDLRSFMERGGTSGYVELPTGTGKTVIFVEFLRVLGVPAVVVVPTKDLVTQTQGRIRQFSSDTNVGVVYSGAKEYDADVVVTTYNSLEKALANPEFDIQSRGIVILDEAHEALGSTRSKVVNGVKGKSLIIGFTATPEYSETKNLGSLLGEKISSMSEREAIESGAKAPCHAMIAKTNYDISTVKITSIGEYDDEELDKIINVAARNKAVAEIAIKKFPEAQKVIFCANVNHAEAVAEQMREMGETVEVVVGKTQEDVEGKYVSLGYKGGWKEAYAKGIISTVLSVDLLTRGTDLPSASVCINAAPTLSLVRAAQRGGRVGRLDPNNPDKHAIVIDVVDAGGLDDPSVSKKSRKRRQPILYYQILGDTVILPRGSKESIGGRGDGGGGGGEDVDIDGITVVVDLEGIISIVPLEETDEEIAEVYREEIKKQYTVGQWVNLMASEKRQIKIFGNGLIAIAKKFGLSGDPVGTHSVHIDLSKKIFGDADVDAILPKEHAREEFCTEIKRLYAAVQWVNMSKEERKQIKIFGNGLIAIARIFGISGNPTNKKDVHFDLGRAIYGTQEINDVLPKDLEEQNKYRSEIMRLYTAEQWTQMKVVDRSKIKVFGKGLEFVSSLFGVNVDRVSNYLSHIDLGRAIYGTQEINDVLPKDLEEQNKYRSEIMRLCTAEQWVNMAQSDRRKVKIFGKGLVAIASVFGVQGDPIAHSKPYFELGSQIYGALVNDVIPREYTKEQCITEIRRLYTAQEWLQMTQRMKKEIKIFNKGLMSIATLLGVKGNPVGFSTDYIALSKIIFGDQVVSFWLEQGRKK